MTNIRLRFEVLVPPQETWELGIQPGRIPEWQFDVVRIESAPARVTAVGATYVLVYRRFGRELPSRVRVTRYEPPSVIETTGETPLGGYFKSMTRMSPMPGGTAVDWEMDYRLPGWIMGSLLDAILFRRAFTETVAKYNENFKAVAERRHPPHPPIAMEHAQVGAA